VNAIKTMPLSADVIEALRVVVDPELGESVVDLGLIYDVVVAEGFAVIEMTTTTRGCPASAYLKQAVENAASAVPGIDFAEIRLTYEPAWVPEMMNDSARRRLGFA
jgi:metal-sulfur cluster biosynthetic enzyme